MSMIKEDQFKVDGEDELASIWNMSAGFFDIRDLETGGSDGSVNEKRELSSMGLTILKQLFAQEKANHEIKILELESEVTTLKSGNACLEARIRTLEDEKQRIGSDFKKRADFIFRHERECFEVKLNQLSKRKKELELENRSLQEKLAMKDEQIADLTAKIRELNSLVNGTRQRTIDQTAVPENDDGLINHISIDYEIYAKIWCLIKDQEAKLKETKEKLSSQEKRLELLMDDCQVLIETRYLEQKRFWQEIEEMEVTLGARDEECLLLYEEVKNLRKDMDLQKIEIKKYQTKSISIKTKCCQIIAEKESLIKELKADGESLQRKMIKLVKEKDMLWKNIQDLANNQFETICDRWMNDKHHCRICGKIYCHACSKYWISSKGRGKLRTCKDCYIRCVHTTDTYSYTEISLNEAFAASDEYGLIEKMKATKINRSISDGSSNGSNDDVETRFDIISDEEIVKSLSATSPYTGCLPQECYYRNLEFDTELNTSLTRYANDNSEDFGLSSEIWVSAGSNLAIPISIDSPNKISFELESSCKAIGFYVCYKKYLESTDVKMVIKEKAFKVAEQPFIMKQSFDALEEGVYIIVINSYSRFIATKIVYRLERCKI